MTAATVIRFKHNDAADLDKRLQRLADTPGNKIIVVEGIYSMLGDQAPLAEIVAVKRKHGAYLVVDEAHSMGVLGEHRPRPRRGGRRRRRTSISSSAPSARAWAPSAASASPTIRSSTSCACACRPYMFTASLPPSIVASVTAALAVRCERRPELRTRLWANVNTLYDGLKRRGFVLGPQKGPVVAVHLPSPEMAVQPGRPCCRAGVYVNLALPPATPNGTALLRCSVCAAHTSDAARARDRDADRRRLSGRSARASRRAPRRLSAFRTDLAKGAAAVEPPGEPGRRQQRMAPLPRRRRRLDAAVALDLPEDVVDAAVEGEHAFDQAQRPIAACRAARRPAQPQLRRAARRSWRRPSAIAGERQRPRASSAS